MIPPDVEQMMSFVEARINLTWRYIVGVLDDCILKRCHDVLLCFVMFLMVFCMVFRGVVIGHHHKKKTQVCHKPYCPQARAEMVR